MQQFKLRNEEVVHRRNGFMRDIRNIQRESIKKRARSEVILRNTQQQLNNLINTTYHYMSNADLSQLVKYANQHNEKAIAHMGNQVITKVITIQELDKFTLQPGFSPIWLWLIQVLVQQEYCTKELFEHCIKTIKPNRPQKSVCHSLSILYKITSSNLYSSILMRNQKILLAIINSTFRMDSASKVAYLLLRELIAKQEDIANKFREGVFKQKMVQTLKNGLMSNIKIIQKNSCNILKELQAKKVCLNAELQFWLITFIKSKHFLGHSQVFLQYLKQFVLFGQKDRIVEMIDLGLLVQLGRLKKDLERDQCEGKVGNIIEICRQIKERTEEMGLKSKGIVKQLNALNLLSFKQQVPEY